MTCSNCCECHAQACRLSRNVQLYRLRAPLNAAKRITALSNVASRRPTSMSANREVKGLHTAFEDKLLRTRECRGASAQDTGHSRVSISRMTMYCLAGSRIMLHKPNPKSRTGVTTDLLGVSGKLVAGMWFVALPEARSAESQPKVWARPPWQRIFGLGRASSDSGAIRRRKRPMNLRLFRGEPASGR